MIQYIKSCYSFTRTLWRLNLIKTFYVNFRCLPVRQAIKLPIHIYGNCKIHSLRGTICIEKEHIHFGMIKIGYRWFDLWPVSYLPTQLCVIGSLVFKGDVTISGGVGIFVQRKTASMVLGHMVYLGGGSLIKSVDKLIVGENTTITGNCIVMNSNMHYVKNIETGIIKKPWGCITIGRNCWVNANSVIAKGTILPDYSVTARNTFLNKDYTEFGTHLFLVGSPAKVTSARVQRIFNYAFEMRWNKFFFEHDEDEAIIEQGEVIGDARY